MKGLCSVFFFDTGVYVFSESLTSQGISIVTGARFKLQPDPKPEALGQAVLEALSGSREGVAFPKDHKALTKEMVTFAGHKSWKSFVQALRRAANVESDGANAVATPNKKGEQGALLPDTDASERLRLDATTVGQWLVKAR